MTQFHGTALHRFILDTISARQSEVVTDTVREENLTEVAGDLGEIGFKVTFSGDHIMIVETRLSLIGEKFLFSVAPENGRTAFAHFERMYPMFERMSSIEDLDDDLDTYLRYFWHELDASSCESAPYDDDLQRMCYSAEFALACFVTSVALENMRMEGRKPVTASP